MSMWSKVRQESCDIDLLSSVRCEDTVKGSKLEYANMKECIIRFMVVMMMSVTDH